MADDTKNLEAFEENNSISKVDTTLDVASKPLVADANPAGPTLVEDVAPGIQPVADFVPKDAPTSHPTPPPDEPLVTSEANVDTEMTSAEDITNSEPSAQPQTDDLPEVEDPSQSETTDLPRKDEPSQSDEILQDAADAEPATASEPAQVSASTAQESSLVRPREDDEDDEDAERAAKRSRVEDLPMPDAPTASTPSEVVGQDGPTSAPIDAKTPEVTKVSDPPQPVEEGAKDATEPETAVAPEPDEKASVAETQKTEQQSKVEDVVAKPEEADAKLEMDAKPSATNVSTISQASGTTNTYQYSKKPISQAQLRFLQDKMKNLKKTKNSGPFLIPVDPVTLNIPTYFDVIKHPMDLSTMEHKLRNGKYGSVQDFANDFHLIINNTMVFNGPDHPVTQAGMAMDAYFRKMMETVPSADAAFPPKPPSKKASPKPPGPSRRESRVVHHPAPAPAPAAALAATTSASEPFALQPDGTPQIRRDSTINRPSRTIKPPPARELSYAKPKRKEHQLELKFCEMALEKIRAPRYGHCNSLFLAPVDPVALNIPHYRQVVKHPMDLGTMAQKLKHGQYGRAAEVKKDFDLMISNCLAFNPPGNAVRDLGIQLQRDFETIWRGKEKWEKNEKAKQRAASPSAEEDSGEEEEEEDTVDVGEDPAGTIAQLQKQLADMQSALAGLGKAPKVKKAKASKSSFKKSGGAAAPKAKAAPSKPKPSKKPKQVTYEEKQEISEAVGKMNNAQVEELTRIITSNCKKYADQDEMELEIDDLPNDVQAMLLTYVRGIFGGPARKNVRAPSPDDLAAVDDDDFEPGERRAGKGGKRKKHKPMGKKEQQDAINKIQSQLAQFQGTGASGSASPINAGYAAGHQDADTSGDDESEESEEE
jgi:bromodomain-containing factor 1